MGCDIHMYVEYRKPDSFNRDGKKYWRAFNNRINPGRDYELFSKLAGVRSDTPALISPRGLPDDLAYYSQDDARLFIVDGDETNSEGCTTLARATEWVKYGCTIHYRDGKPIFVDHPDWHSHSWLTPNEFDRALQVTALVDYGDTADSSWRIHGECDDSCYALLAAMRDLESRGNEVRVVFWFDN